MAAVERSTGRETCILFNNMFKHPMQYIKQMKVTININNNNNNNTLNLYSAYLNPQSRSKIPWQENFTF